MIIIDKEISEIIERIRKQRDKMGFSYQDLSEKTGLSKSTLQRYETGAIKNMPIGKLEIIAKALEVSPIYLMGWEKQIKELNDNEKQILELYNNLDSDGKKVALEMLEFQSYKILHNNINSEIQQRTNDILQKTSNSLETKNKSIS